MRILLCKVRKAFRFSRMLRARFLLEWVEVRDFMIALFE